MTATLSESDRLSAALRTETAAVHEQAETSSFVQQLMSGALPLSAYAGLVVQNHAIYAALEGVADRWRDDPVAGPFLFAELVRLPRLESDLEQLLGAGWRELAEAQQVPATRAYVAHIEAVCGRWAGGFVAHHYVRYLGDLSGGQIIRTNIGRIYGAEGEHSTGFYVFDQIAKIKPFRDRYRDQLDAVPVSADERARIVAEAVVAFDLNRAVFTDLGTHYLHVPQELPASRAPGIDLAGGDERRTTAP